MSTSQVTLQITHRCPKCRRLSLYMVSALEIIGGPRDGTVEPVKRIVQQTCNLCRQEFSMKLAATLEEREDILRRQTKNRE